MADIQPYIEQIQNAVYGEEVRSSIVNALEKVNDDNDSYADLKEEVIAAKDAVESDVAEIQKKIDAASTTITGLEDATGTASTARTNLQTVIDNADAANNKLTTTTDNADSTNSTLQAMIDNANSKIAEMQTVETGVQSTVKTANTTNSTLQTTIDNATQKGNELNTTIGTAADTKSNLDTSIKNANTIRTQLQDTTSTADSARTSLSEMVNTANTTTSNLETASNKAEEDLQSLSAEITSAKTNLNQLQSENFNSQEILAGVTDIRAYLGMIETDNVLGLQVDYKNKTFTRLAGAKNLTAGDDFNKFTMYKNRTRCNVADDGTILAEYGDDGYTEDGSNGQVMVYQPKFYYLVCPVEYDMMEVTEASDHPGYHLRKANYYITDEPRTGFKLHPAFYDKNGNEVDYVLIGAFEGCLYDTSATSYILDDSQVMTVSEDKLSSIAGARPASGITQSLTRANVEKLAQNRGTDWHSLNIKITSMEQLLMMIELGTMNFQTAIGLGVTSITDDSSSSCASYTGGTNNLTIGLATETKDYTGTVQTAAGKTSIGYRGVENFWSNIWKFVDGINIYGAGYDSGGVHICTDFNYKDDTTSDNYEYAGIRLSDKTGYISAMGYNVKYDWLFIPSESNGNSSLPVGDTVYVDAKLNAYRIARLGGSWISGSSAGGFCWSLRSGSGFRDRGVGGRLVYVPTATAA